MKIYYLPLLLLALALHFTPRAAAGGVVTSCDQAGLTRALSGGGTVSFRCDGVITLTNTLTIGTNVVIDGTGHSVTISGGGSVRLFTVNPGAQLVMYGVTLANAKVTGTPALGGAIFNSGGQIAVAECTFTNNSANGSVTVDGAGGDAGGGDLYCFGGEFNATNCVFANGTAAGGNGTFQNSFPGGLAKGGSLYCEGTVVNLSNCTFATNSANGGLGGLTFTIVSPGSGGAIYCAKGALAVDDCKFFGNICAGGLGGAIFVSDPGASVIRSTFSNNVGVLSALTSTGSVGGGAIGNGGQLTVTNCAFISNQGALGGAIYSSGPLEMWGCAFTSNASVGSAGSYNGRFSSPGGRAFGGAIYAMSQLGLINCSFFQNSARGGDGILSSAGGGASGGGVALVGSAAVTNCTFFANSASGGQPGSTAGVWGPANGGAFACLGGSAVFNHVTISSNVVASGVSGGDGVGGGLSVSGGATLIATIIANRGYGGDCAGPITDGGQNISSDASCNFSAADSRNNTDPMLGAFADHGGPTFTVSLLPGSPAIDAGSATNCPATDQRGVPRPYGSGCDIGAYELSLPAPPASGYRANSLTSQVLGNGWLDAVFAGEPGHPYRVQVSTDLRQWSLLQTNVPDANGLFEFIDPGAPSAAIRFYRVAGP